MAPTKAFLLSDGRARLGPLTETTPQCLLPVGGRPLLHWWLRICERLGVAQVLLNTHEQAAQVRDFVRTRTSSVRVTLYHEEKPLGTAGTLAVNRHFAAGETAFWILDAGTLVGADLTPLAELHKAQRADLTLGLSVEPGTADYVLGDDGRALAAGEGRSTALGPGGAALAGPRLMTLLPKLAGDLHADVYPKLLDNAWGLKLDRAIRLDSPQSLARAQREFPGFGLR